MQKRILLFWSISLFLGTISFAQVNNGCDGQRYIQDVTTEFEVIRDIQFGEGVTIGGNTKSLLMAHHVKVHLES